MARSTKPFALQLKREIAAARSSEKNPARDARGEIKWEKTLPFAVRALPDEIAAQARAFFASVYDLGGVDRGALQEHEEANGQQGVVTGAFLRVLPRASVFRRALTSR